MSDRPFNVPVANKNIPPLNDPVADVNSLVDVVKRMRQGLDSLAGYRGASQRAATFDDLAGLGVIGPINTATGGVGNNPSGFATNTALAGEAATREKNDAAEAAARQAADQGLTDDIAAEAAARAAGDATEAGARAAADTALQADIDTESIARANADAAEAADRIAADNALQAQIDALETPVVSFAGLPASPAVGQDAVVLDATVNAWGAAVTIGGGSMVVKVWWNGAAWSVFGR